MDDILIDMEQTTIDDGGNRMETLVDLFDSFPGHGERIAIIYRTGVRCLSYTYSRLHGLALRMNGWLATAGVKEGDRILLWGPNSPGWSVAFWGAVARGAIVVPVDFMAGIERAEAIATLTGGGLIIQSRYKTERVSGLRTVIMEELEFVLNGCEPLAATTSTVRGDTAQLIFTSGTTGNPKGVILTHGNLVTNLKQVNQQIPVVTPEYGFLSLLPLSHMFEQMAGYFTPLLHGSSIVYLRTLKPSAIMEALAEEDIYAMIAVPRLLQLLRGSIERELAAKGLERGFRRLLGVAGRAPVRLRRLLFLPVRRRFGRNLSLFISGGAPLAGELFRFWNAMGFTVIEGYGLTECSPVLTANTPERQVEGSVGTPLPGVEIRFNGGEVEARGENIFPGYYMNEAATGGAFTDDGWFRTGDLGEMDASGCLRLKGRSKELIVTSAGVNVYPDEIETELNRAAGVREACVLGVDRGKGEEVHAVLLLDGSGRSPEEIVGAVNERLDPLVRITGFTVWQEGEFPKTTTLKIRKFQVREMIGRAGRSGAGPVAGDRLIEMIARATGAPAGEIGEMDILASGLGLTSIARLELVNMLEQEYRIDLDDSMIGPQTTVAELRGMIGKPCRDGIGDRCRFWTNSPAVRWTRKLFDLFLNYPLFRLVVRLEVAGLDHLLETVSPFMLVANHTSYLDQPAVMFAMPGPTRYRTATAAWAEFFFVNFKNPVQRLWKRCCFEYGSFALNLFPLPQSGGFRGALRFMGRLADSGINILIFPEGERSRNGGMLPFRNGVGVMVRELGLPVVPVHISGLEYVLPRGALWPRRGTVRVVFGKPLRFQLETPEEIVATAARAVRELGG